MMINCSYGYGFSLVMKFCTNILQVGSFISTFAEHLCISFVFPVWEPRGQYYKTFMLVNYDSGVVKRGILKSGTTLES